MPISKYYSGSGKKVMRAMKKTYGAKKAKRIFYATANKAAARRMIPTKP